MLHAFFLFIFTSTADAAVYLQAIQFASWSEAEQLAFWVLCLSCWRTNTAGAPSTPSESG